MSSDTFFDTREWPSDEEGEESPLLDLEDLDAPEVEEILIELAEGVIPETVEELEAIVEQIGTAIKNLRHVQLNFRHDMSVIRALRADPPLPEDLRTLLRLEVMEKYNIRLLEHMDDQNADMKEAAQSVDILAKMSELAGSNGDIAAHLKASGAQGTLANFSEAMDLLTGEKKSLTELLNDVMEFYRYLAARAGHNTTQAGTDADDD